MKFPFTKKCEILVSDALQTEKVIVFPTETFYGIGGNAFSKSVVGKIYKIKRRSTEKSFILLINLEWLDKRPTLIQLSHDKPETITFQEPFRIKNKEYILCGNINPNFKDPTVYG